MMQMIIPSNSIHLVCTQCGKGILIDDIAVLNEGMFVCFHCWVSKPHEDTNWDRQVVMIKEYKNG